MGDNHQDPIDAPPLLAAKSDICQQLLDRYAHSSAAQHRHLCATAGATRSIIQSSSLPLTPLSYFAATITSLSNSSSLDDTALAALTSFLSIALPLVERGEIKPKKSEEAVRVLLGIVEESGGSLGTASVRAVVKCVGVLVAQFCDLDDWDSFSVGFQWLLKFALDKRPKVRKCAQDCLLMAVKSFKSSTVINKASKAIYSLLKDHMPVAIEMAASECSERAKDDAALKPEHQEVLHLLNVMKDVVPYLSVKVCNKILLQLSKTMSSHFSQMTRHVFDVISVLYDTIRTTFVVPVAEDIIKLLASYISYGDKNPADSRLFAATLAKSTVDKLHDADFREWTIYLPQVSMSISDLLFSEAETALKASNILKELISYNIDGKYFYTAKGGKVQDEAGSSPQTEAIKATCSVFYNLLSISSQMPNKHLFAVIAVLFGKIGKSSDIFMKDIVLKLSNLMSADSGSDLAIECLHDCIGSAITAMGPEKFLALVPISLNVEDLSCSNTWLIPILKKHIVGSSLEFFMEHIVPLAGLFQQASSKVKKSVIGQDLQACAHGCWGLLPAFCRQPSDTYHNFGALAELLIPLLKRDSFIIEDVAISLQELVNENNRVLSSKHMGTVDKMAVELRSGDLYTKKTARKNIKALASGSKELLQPLTKVLFKIPSDKREHVKGAIECLASITDSSVIKDIFIASLQKFKLLDDIDEHGKESDIIGKADEESDAALEKDMKRCQILELASCFVEGSGEDLVHLFFRVVKCALQATDEIGQVEAYKTLSRILEKHSWFRSSKFVEVMDLLSEVKAPNDIRSLQGRFACFRSLLIHAVMSNVDEDQDHTQTFLILNEIILSLKDSNDEGRRVSYDVLNGLSSELKKSSKAISNEPYHKLITMITGYLSGSSPHIKSGVVAALSVLVYNDPEICLSMPDVVPSVLELLHSKAVEVIKAVLGFVKVLVSCLQANDLQHFLPVIIDEVLRWSSVSRHHFKSKVTVILEIMMRKLGSSAIKALAPEKYKDFVQGVSENRHGKSTTKEVGTAEAEPERSDFSTNRQQKRKRVESVISHKEDIRGPRKRIRDSKKQDRKPFKRHGDSEQDNMNHVMPRAHLGGATGDFKKDRFGGKKYMEMSKSNIKGNKGNVHTPSNSTKFSKQKRMGKKR